jgi:hypothetical protein
MNTIIAGRFDEQAQVEQTVTALEASGFARGQIATFFLNSPGQHDLAGTVRDPDASAGAHHAGAGAATGAATGSGVGTVVGLATVPVLGPVGPLAGAAIGAYVGALAGALEKLGDAEPGDPAVSEHSRDDTPPRKSGMLVAVSAPSSAEETSAITVLRAQGAADMERAQGNIEQGLWNDFDPLTTPALVTTAHYHHSTIRAVGYRGS